MDHERADHEHPDHEHGRRQLERLTFFSDAVYAIAMTLLVIEVRLPDLAYPGEAALMHALVDLVPRYFAFVLSFLVIGRFWLAHHRVFGLLVRTSERLLWVNLLELMAIAFMPFPTSLISAYGGARIAVLVYAGWLLALGLIQRALVVTAVGRRSPLVRADVPQAERAFLLRGSWIPAVIGVLAIAGTLYSARGGLLVLVFASPLVFRLLHWRGAGAAASGRHEPES